MDQFVDVVEREQVIFNVEVKDPGAPVDFFINGKKVSKSDERCEYQNLGEGKHQLVIHNIKMEDMGTVEAKTPSNRGDQVLTSSTAFDVTKGEEAPEIGDTGPVTGVAYKECSWKVPYKVNSSYFKQQTPLIGEKNPPRDICSSALENYQMDPNSNIRPMTSIGYPILEIHDKT